MKEWRIPVTWEMCGTVTVQAGMLAEAMKKARNDASIPLPEESVFVDGSFDLSVVEEETVREFYNNNQKDEGEE